jgi:S1-C subfamily serine protease
VFGAAAGLVLAACTSFTIVVLGWKGRSTQAPPEPARAAAAQSEPLPKTKTDLPARPVVSGISPRQPSPKPQDPPPAAPKHAPQSPLAVQLAAFGPARFEQEEFAGRPLTGVIVEIEASTANLTGRFEASAVSAVRSSGVEVPAAVIFTAGGKEGLAATAKVLAGSLGKTVEVTIGRDRYQSEARMRFARALNDFAVMKFDKGQVISTVNQGGLLSQIEVFAETTIPLITRIGRGGALESASTAAATEGRVHLALKERVMRVGDFLVAMPLILARGGGVEYGFVPGNKVRLGFLFAASPESLARVKLLGRTLDLESARRSGDLVLTPAEASRPASKKVGDRVKPSVALIEGKYGHGSGFLVAPNVIATNSHVVLNDLLDNVTVRFTTNGLPDDKGLKVRLLYEDKGRDLVLLVLEKDPRRPALAVAKAFSTMSRPEVFVVGNPAQALPGMALTNVVAQARCDEEVVLFEKKPYYRLNFPTGPGDILIGPGNSGGPTVNENGEVIGIVTLAEIGRDRRPAGRAYCIPANAIHDALKEVGPAQEWKPRIEKATARHTLDIAAINVYANALLGFALIESRTKLPGGRSGIWFPGDLNRLLENDKELIKIFQAADRRFRDISGPAIKAVNESYNKELPSAELWLLRGMREKLDQLRATVRKQQGFSAAEYKRAETAQEQCRKNFDKICKESGMGAEFIQLMLTTVMREAGINVVRRSR